MANQLGSAITRPTAVAHSPRQLELDRRYGYFRGTCYDGRTLDWNGDPLYDSNVGIGRERDIPPGYTDSTGATTPLRARRPSAPYYLARVVVKRFTGLLFSKNHHPKLRVFGDADTEDWVDAAVEAGRLWPQMISARDMGGSQGSVAVGFEIANGVPVFEVFDARYCTPKFTNRLSGELASLDQVWAIKEYVRDPDDGRMIEVQLWCRRYVDKETDTLWQGVFAPEGDVTQIDWNSAEAMARATVREHGFGEVPIEWIQNVVVEGEVDGDSDCHGAYDQIEQIDTLTSQGIRGTIANCDATLVVATDDEVPPDLEKGSEKFITVNKGDQVMYLEMAGSGSKLAFEQADKLEEKVLRLVQCVLDQGARPSGAARTATEVEKDYSSMHEKGDVLREQYGERGVKRLVAKLIRAAQRMAKTVPTRDADGNLARPTIMLPPRVVTLPDGKVKLVERKLGPGGVLSLQWPPYATPTPADAEVAVRTAGNAMSMKLVDHEHAAQMVAPYFQVEDVKPMLQAMDKADRAAEDLYTQQTLSAAAPTGDAGPSDLSALMDDGLVTVDELRASKGLGPLAQDGDLTVPQFKAKYAQTFARVTMAANEIGAEKLLGMGDDGDSVASAAE
jgi:hypothetical protein